MTFAGNPTPNRPRRVALALGLAASTLLAGCSFGAPPPDQAGAPPKLPTPSASASSEPDAVSSAVEVIAKHLNVPWGVAFLPDGTGLVTERNTAKILKVGPDPATGGADGLAVSTVQTVPGVAQGADGGLLGIAVSPKYATDQTVFIYYSTARDNRIASLKLGGTPVPIVTGIPHSTGHNGGALAFGPDGYLYASTGEAANPASPTERNAAQALTGLTGKILRMTPAGKPAPGNPYKTLVYSYGHRDVQGLAWDKTKRLYATDPDQGKFDELDLITPGKNYGWPVTAGSTRDPKYVDPLLTWATDQGGCSGLAVSGDLLIAGCLTGKVLYAVQLTRTGSILGAPQPLLANKFGRLRTVAAAPDGSLWVTTSNRDGQGQPGADDDQILRIVPAGSAGSLS